MEMWRGRARVLKLGGAETPENYSNHAMTGKELPRLRIACDGGVAHINDGVLDIGVPQAILHEGNISPGVEEMYRDRMTQGMKSLLGFRYPSALAILLHQVPVGQAFQGDATCGDKEVGRIVIAGP